MTIRLSSRLFEWLAIVAASVVMCAVLGDDQGHADEPLVQKLLISFTFTASIWEGNRMLFGVMRRRWPRPDQTVRRLAEQIPVQIVFTIVTSLLLKTVLGVLLPECRTDAADMLKQALFNLMPTAVVTLFYESRYFFVEWKANLTRVESLARTAAQSQLDALRQQLDPHFLFNSLNTLAALIDDDEPAQAQRYLSQLADVYRYVLLAKDRDTVPLHEELAFVDAYIALNKVRFRENLLVENTIPASSHQRRVAPLSVQTLVENALKHNVISREHPLALRLEAAGPDTIRVANPVRPKALLAPGTRVGLANLVRRYALLTTTPVEVSAEGGEFQVSLPLL